MDSPLAAYREALKRCSRETFDEDVDSRHGLPSLLHLPPAPHFVWTEEEKGLKERSLQWQLLQAKTQGEEQKQLASLKEANENEEVAIRKIASDLVEGCAQRRELTTSRPLSTLETTSVVARDIAAVAVHAATFHRPSPGELSAMRQLEQSCFGDAAATSSEVEAHFIAAPELFLGAYLGEQMVGLVRACWASDDSTDQQAVTYKADTSNTAWIQSVVVDPEFQRRSIGHKLVASFLLQMQYLAGPTGSAQSLKCIKCEVSSIQTSMSSILSSNGFTCTEGLEADSDVFFKYEVEPLITAWCKFAVVAGAAVDALWEGLPGEGDSIWHHTALRNLSDVVEQWRPKNPAEIEGFNFAIHIGDAIDGKGTQRQCLQDLQKFTTTFQKLRPLLTAHCIGDATLSVGREQATEMLELERTWYSLSEADADGFSEGGAYHVLCLDVYDDEGVDQHSSSSGLVSSSQQHSAGRYDIDSALDTSDTSAVRAVEMYTDGPTAQSMSGEHKRKLSLSPPQLLWIQERLLAAQEEGTAVIIISHRPIIPVNGKQGISVLAELLLSFRRTVRLCISADSESGFHVNVGGIDHVGLETMAGSKAYGELELHPTCCFVKGYSRMTSRVIPKQHDSN